MALKVGELYGELKLDQKPFNKGLDQSEGRAKGWSGKVGGILGKAAGFLAKWGAIGATAVGGFGYLTAGMASDLAESMSKVDVVFGTNSNAIKMWADDAALNMGMSKENALAAAGTFGNLFVSMKIGAGPTKDMSKGIVELAGDLASFNNLDPTEVLDKLRAGLVGETEPLRALGVNISAVATEAKAMELGFEKVDGQLSAAAKAQANYAIIMEQTATAQGDFARTSDGMANQQRILSATVSDSMASIGAAFMPIFVEILPHLVAAFGQLAAWVTVNMPTIQSVIGTVFGTIGSVISFIFTEIVPKLITAFGWIIDNVIPALVAAFQQGKEGVNVLADVFEWVRINILPPLRKVFEVFTKQVLPALKEAFSAVQGWIKANWPAISSIVMSVAAIVRTAFNLIAAVISAVMPIIIEVARIVFPALGGAATLAINVIATAFKIGEQVFRTFATVVSGVVSAVRAIWNSFKGFFKSLWDTLGGILKGGVNLLISLINGLLGVLNNIRVGIPSIGIPGTDIQMGGGFFDPFNIPLIPKLAKGGLATEAGLAIVGEQGPELVALPKGAQVMSNEDSRGGKGNTFNVFGLQPGDVTREVMRAERRLAMEWNVR